MTRRIFIFLMAGLAIAGLVSCNDEAGTATMKLLLKKTEVVPKTFIPADTADLRVARYTIHGEGPENGTFDVSTDSPSVTINGLKVGNWTITAKGANSEGVFLIQGTGTVVLGPDSGTTTIILDTMVGSGTLELTIDWSNTEVPDPSLELHYQVQGGTEQNLSFTANYGNRTATAKATLAAGSYIIRGVLKSGDFQIGGFVETARLVGGQTTSGEVSISQMEYTDASAYFYLDDRLGEPVRGTLSGFDTGGDGGPTLTADADAEISFTLEESFRPTPDFQIQWFLDGIQQGGAATLGATNKRTFRVCPGSHRIDAVVNNNLLGSYGSVSQTFEALSTGEAGSVSKLNDFAQILVGQTGGANNYISLGEDTIVSPLPGGKFLVVSPANGKILVLKPVRNYVEVKKIFTAAEFPYVGSITKVKSDGVKPWVALQDDQNGASSLTFLKYDSQTDDLVQFGGLGRIQGSFPAGTTTATLGNIHAIGFNPNKNTIHIGDAAFKLGSGAPSSVLLYFKVDEDANTVGFVGKDSLGSGFADGCDLSVSPSGGYIAATQTGSPQIVVGKVHNDGGIYSTKTLGGLLGDARHVFMVDDSLILASGSTLQSFNFDFSALPNGGTPTRADLGGASDLVVANGGQTCVYSMDKTGRTVTAFSRSAGGTVFSRLGICSISADSSDRLTGMALSGSYLLVSSASGKLSLCRVL